MKHAGMEALDALEDLLAEIRRLEGLKEKKRGTFYRGSSGFVHFHEDPAGLFADLRYKEGWKKYRVNTRAEKKEFMTEAQALLEQS
jgi:hypothetical protein